MLLDRMKEDSVIPVHMDGTVVEGWEQIDFGIRRSRRNTREIADLILAKYQQRQPNGTDLSVGSSVAASDVATDSLQQSSKLPNSASLMQIFVSHHQSDVEFARQLRDRLNNHRDIDGRQPYHAWIADYELGVGDDWRQEIDDALQKSQAIVVVISPEASESKYVTYEWAYSIGGGIPVIPIVWRPSSVHPRLDGLHYLDFADLKTQPWQRLFEDLAKKLAKSKTMSRKPAVIEGLQQEVESIPVNPIIQESELTAEHAEPSPIDALLVVDVQQDFFRNGALPVSGAESLIKPLNQAIDMAQEYGVKLIFSRDWHPNDHRSFVNMSPDGAWPKHCVQNTPGARFHSRLHVPEDSEIVSIGVDNSRLGYSAFEDDLMVNIMTSPDISTLYIAGLALEYCVQATALEAAEKYGKRVVILDSLVRAASNEKAKLAPIWQYLESQGVERHAGADPFATSEQVASA